MMDFYLIICLRFLIKLEMASQTLSLPEMNLSQCCTQSFFGNNGKNIYCVLEWNWRPSTMVGACVKNFKNLEYVNYLKNELLSWSKVFLQTLFQKIWAQSMGAHTNLSIRKYLWVRYCKFQQPGYYDFRAVTFSNYTHTGKPLEK